MGTATRPLHNLWRALGSTRLAAILLAAALLASSLASLFPQMPADPAAYELWPAALARGLDDTEFAYRAAAHLRALRGHRLMAVNGALSGLAARLAVECRLRGCDAIYAALVRQEGMPLITWDEQQRERAAPVVETLTPTEALAALE